MGLFDRFTSKKGKDQNAGPKRGVVKATKAKDAEQKAFASVPAAKDDKAPVAKKESKKDTAPATQSSSSMSHVVGRVLLRPVVTEKTSRGGSQSQYTFEIARTASKTDVKQSVHHLYGVTPVAVNIVTMRGKAVRFGRTYGRTVNRKKAIVTLPAGKTIDVVSA